MKRTRWLFLVAVVAVGALSAGCVVETSCIDDDNDGFCAIEDCDDLDSSIGPCSGCLFDDDNDGFCWADDCNDLDAAIGPCNLCAADDMDCDGESDLTDCYDDYNNEYVCVDIACTPADNICEDSWYLVYCVDSVFYGTDCNTSCTTDERVYGTTCAGTPAASGECGAAEGACICWCEDSFDSCVNDWTVQYTREGTTYEVDCKTYCGGTCDLNAGACACP